MSELAQYKKEAKQAAVDFGYGEAVINAIRKAKSEAEIRRIMITARHNKWKDD